MTAIVIMRSEFGFQICSDGSCYDSETYRLKGLVHKIQLLPAYSGFIAYRGLASVMPFFQSMVETNYTTFDHIIEDVEGLARSAAIASGMKDRVEAIFTIYIGGWSESRERFENYAISPDERENADGEVTRKAFELTPSEQITLAPSAPMPILDSLGLLTPEGDYIFDWKTLPLYIHAARLMEDEAGAIAGGFIQETYVTKDRTTIDIVHRYDDAQGFVMEPDESESAAIMAICAARA